MLAFVLIFLAYPIRMYCPHCDFNITVLDIDSETFYRVVKLVKSDSTHGQSSTSRTADYMTAALNDRTPARALIGLAPLAGRWHVLTRML